MVVELLKVLVDPSLQVKYLELDRQIWTSLLASYPGFIKKEIWKNPNLPNEICIVIYWKSKEQWQQIPLEVLEQTDARFFAAFVEKVAIVESLEYEVV